jgi:hypothetical protein
VQARRPIGFVTVGYMDALFVDRDEARAFYERHNPHMRPMDALGVSDCDPAARRRYVLREYVLGTALSLPAFDAGAGPVPCGRCLTRMPRFRSL